MVRPHPKHAGARNAAVAAGTGGLLALLFSHPTSTNAEPQQDAVPAGMSGAAGVAGATVVTGPVVPTGDYGPVQVRAWLRDGRVVGSEALVYPHTRFGGNFIDDILSGKALPELAASSVAYGDGRVDTVSTVTYTSEAYRTSLQAAVDAANNSAANNSAANNSAADNSAADNSAADNSAADNSAAGR